MKLEINEYKTVRLEDILERYIGGLWGDPAGKNEVDAKVLRITEIADNGEYDSSTAVTRSFTRKQLASRLLLPGDLVLEKSGGGPNTPVGRVFQVRDEGVDTICSNFMLQMRPNTNLVLSTYLHLFLTFLHATGQTIPLQSASTNIRNMSTPDYMNVPVPLPSLKVQEQIVAFFQQAFTALDKTVSKVTEASKKSTHLRMSILHQIFTTEADEYAWDMRKIDYIAKPIVGKNKTQRGWSPQCLNHPVTDLTKWGVLKTTAIQLGEYWPQYNKELPDTLEPKPHLAVEAGDLIMTSTGPRSRCGIPCLVDSTPPNLMMSGKMFRVRADETKVLPKWLLYYLLSPIGQVRLENLKVGSSDSSLSIGSRQFLDIDFPVPPLAIQEAKIAEIEDCFSLAEAFDKECFEAARNFNALRLSIMHATFTGSIQPRSLDV